MSDEQAVPEDNREQEIECSICGRAGIPPKACTTCLGGAKVQERTYTLSELRGMSQEERDRITRGNRPSGAPPRIVHLPGSA